MFVGDLGWIYLRGVCKLRHVTLFDWIKKVRQTTPEDEAKGFNSFVQRLVWPAMLANIISFIHVHVLSRSSIRIYIKPVVLFFLWDS